LCERSALARELLLATLFGALTALGAQVAVRLPFTPVPLTGQVFFVLLAAGSLGGRLAAISQMEYLALGLAGMPVFAGGTGGPAAFAGPTGGYLLGFVAAAFVAGRLAERWRWRSLLAVAAALSCGLAMIYLCGGLWLAGWHMIMGRVGVAAAVWLALVQGVVPFVGVDAGKLALAAAIAWREGKAGRS
jgi:biotin transport system substrate-specific component